MEASVLFLHIQDIFNFSSLRVPVGPISLGRGPLHAVSFPCYFAWPRPSANGFVPLLIVRLQVCHRAVGQLYGLR